MNKPLLIAALVLGCAGRSAAQSRPVPAPNLPADSLTGRIRFAGVVAVPGASAAELQARAREWVALTFEDAHQVTQLDDAARGVLIGRGYTTMYADATAKQAGPPTPLFFTFRLDFREGRYRYELSGLGTALAPMAPATGLDYTAWITSRQFYEVSAWQLGATATVEASPRHDLFQPAYSANPADYNVTARYGRRWPPISAGISKSLAQLLESLRRQETAVAGKW